MVNEIPQMTVKSTTTHMWVAIILWQTIERKTIALINSFIAAQYAHSPYVGTLLYSRYMVECPISEQTLQNRLFA